MDQDMIPRLGRDTSRDMDRRPTPWHGVGTSRDVGRDTGRDRSQDMIRDQDMVQDKSQDRSLDLIIKKTYELHSLASRSFTEVPKA